MRHASSVERREAGERDIKARHGETRKHEADPAELCGFYGSSQAAYPWKPLPGACLGKFEAQSVARTSSGHVVV